MSDQTDEAPIVEPPAPTEQSSEQGTTIEAPPWGDDFQPERAWQTITHLRGFEPDAKAYKRLAEGQDPEAFRDLMSKYGYEVAEPEPEAEPSYDPDDQITPVIEPLASEIAELRQWREQTEMEKALEAFDKQVDILAGESELQVERPDREWLLWHAAQADGGLTQENIKQAFETHKQRVVAAEQAAIERYKQSLQNAGKTPVVTPSGQPASEVPPDPSDKPAWNAWLQRLAEQKANNPAA